MRTCRLGLTLYTYCCCVYCAVVVFDILVQLLCYHIIVVFYCENII